MFLDVACHEGIDCGSIVGIEVAATDEVVGQAPGFVTGPRSEGGDKGALVDKPDLKSEQSEKEMAVCGGSHGVAPIGVGRSAAGHGIRGRPGNRNPVGAIIAI